MSKFQAIKRKQAQEAAAAANRGLSGKPSKSTSDDDLPALSWTSSLAPSPSPAPSSASSSQYPLPSVKDLTRRRWNLEQSSSSSSSSSSSTSLSASLLSSRELTFPSGFLSGDHSDSSSSSSSSASSSPAVLSKTADLVYASAMNTATAPGKQLLMTAFMLWMSGNSLQIFSIMMLGMAFWQPLQRLMSVQAEFARYASSNVNVTVPKLVFLACNVAGVALALYKSNSMGLLPTSSADWISTAVRPVTEFSGGGH